MASAYDCSAAILAVSPRQYIIRFSTRFKLPTTTNADTKKIHSNRCIFRVHIIAKRLYRSSAPVLKICERSSTRRSKGRSLRAKKASRRSARSTKRRQAMRSSRRSSRQTPQQSRRARQRRRRSSPSDDRRVKSRRATRRSRRASRRRSSVLARPLLHFECTPHFLLIFHSLKRLYQRLILHIYHSPSR